MNIEDPKELAAAFAPTIAAAEARVMASLDESIQRAIDRINGIKIKIPVLGDVEISVPDRDHTHAG